MNLFIHFGSKTTQRSAISIWLHTPSGICILSTKRTVDGTDEPICRPAVETQMENRIVDTVGEGGTNWESSMETYTLPYVKQSHWEFAVRCRELTSGALWQPTGWDGWVHPNSCQSSRWCHPAISSSVVPFYGRDQYNIVKQLSTHET